MKDGFADRSLRPLGYDTITSQEHSKFHFVVQEGVKKACLILFSGAVSAIMQA